MCFNDLIIFSVGNFIANTSLWPDDKHVAGFIFDIFFIFHFRARYILFDYYFNDDSEYLSHPYDPRYCCVTLLHGTAPQNQLLNLSRNITH